MFIDPFLEQYPLIATSVAVFITASAAFVVVYLFTHGYPPGRARQVMAMLGAVFIASTLVGLLSAMRTLLPADPVGMDFIDRLFRIALIALRVFVLGGLATIIYTLLRR